ncbi:hypothetical protein HW260_08445 [Helicobacter cinaedi]|uniref:hypothetical protein n=1 Tax=Helicobacter cinaedi TaxID=213 RepID=UPI0001978A66|nr:hypothetical protein [Helicobacter cinaedi]QOQ90269.1 hypothetical protein HW260_08445 [Helicobacter cinaedi]
MAKRQINPKHKGASIYLNTPSKKPTLKSILRKCYRKAQAVFRQIDFVPSGHFYSPIANAKEIEEGIAHRSYVSQVI